METLLRMLGSLGLLSLEGRARLELRIFHRIARELDELESRLTVLKGQSLYVDNGIITRLRNANIHIKTAGGSLTMNIIESKKAA